MRKCKFALMALMLSMVSWKAYALEQNVKMGKPTDEEMSMTSYEEDADAAKILVKNGYKVIELDEGYNGWVSKGMPVTKQYSSFQTFLP